MAFWDRVSEELKRAAAEGWEAVKAGTKVAAEKSEEVAKTGKLRYKSHTVHKKADKLFGHLGGIVYDMAEPPFENPLLRADVQKLIEDIKQAESEATAIDEEVERVKKSASSDASDVPYYYEAKSENRNEAGATEDNEDEDTGGDKGEEAGDKGEEAGDKGGEGSGEGGEGSGEGVNGNEHACFSNCSGPCQCTDHTTVNSDLPEESGAAEGHAYECPPDEESSKESSECDDADESCESKGDGADEGSADEGSADEGSADEGSADESSADEDSADEDSADEDSEDAPEAEAVESADENNKDEEPTAENPTQESSGDGDKADGEDKEETKD